MSEESSLIFIIKARTEKALRKINSFTKGVGQSTKEMSAFQKAGVIAAGVLVRDMVRGATAAFSETIKLGASIETLTNSFNALTKDAGVTSLTLESLREATRGTISDVDLLTAANTALALGLPVDELDDLFAASMDVGHAMGLTTLQAVSDITRGMGRLSPLILDNLGIIVNTELAYETYAATLGKTVSALTVAEKRTAFQTAALESLNKKAVVLEGTTSDAAIAQERFAASMENLKTSVGGLLTPLGAVAPILEEGMPMFGTFAAVLIPGLITKYGALGTATMAWGTITAAASKLVSMSIYGIPIIGWIVAAIAAVIALHTAWKNNWFGIRDIAKNVSDAVMEKIGWLLDGVKGFTSVIQTSLGWLGDRWKALTGKLDEELRLQKSSLETAYADQVQIIKDNMAAAVEEAETKYADMRAVAEDSHSKEIEEQAKFWTDQLAEQVEGFDKAVEEYTKHYDQIMSDSESHYDTLLSDTQSHYDDLLSETTTSYDDQLSETQTFYNDMLSEQSAFLTSIREGRSQDLDDLELNFLLEKRALEQAFADQRVSLGAFEEKLSILEREYRDKRADVRDNYRIQELQAEEEFRTEEERINAERVEALETIEKNKVDAITTIEDELKTKTEELEQAKADEVVRINEERKAKIKEIRADEAALEKDHAYEMEQLERKKAVEIAGIQAQAELDILNGQKQLHIDIEAAETAHKKASTDTWKDLWANLTKGSEGATTNITKGFEIIEYGESPGGIRDVIKAAKDLDKIWNRTVGDLATPGLEFTAGATMAAAGIPTAMGGGIIINMGGIYIDTIGSDVDEERLQRRVKRGLMDALKDAGVVS